MLSADTRNRHTAQFRLSGIGTFFHEKLQMVIKESPATFVGRVHDTQVFLKMTAIELRRISERAPEVAVELRHMAEQIEREVEELARSYVDHCTPSDSSR